MFKLNQIAFVWNEPVRNDKVYNHIQFKINKNLSHKKHEETKIVNV